VTKHFLRPGGLFLATLALDVGARLIEQGREDIAFTTILDWSVVLAGIFYLAGHVLEYVESLSIATTHTFRCACSQLVVINITARRLVAVLRDARLIETEHCFCGSGKSLKNCCMRKGRDE
jgi:hypothetical protein